jgi:hypothetical protein
MILNKSTYRALVLSAAMVLACVWQSTAGTAAHRKSAPQAALPQSFELQSAKTANQAAQKTLDQDLDTIFAKTKAAFDKMAASPLLKSAKVKPVNAFFWKSLKAHQPWHSVLRTDKKGAVINEVIRIEGESKEKRTVAGEAWFTQVSKTMKEHLTVTKNEKTGRYYLVWAAPLVAKVKGVETFQGAVVADIDLWDCFDRFSDKSMTPFKIHILDRVVLYEHMWKDTIKYAEKHLIVPGLEKITVRYPRIASEAASMHAADSAAAVAAAFEQARLDSIKTKAAADSALKAAAAKKAKSHNAVIRTVLIIIGLLVLIVVVVMLVMNRRKPEETSTEEGKDRFGNL